MKQQKIIVESYVHVGGALVKTDQLPPEQQVQLAKQLKTTYLNHLFAETVRFWFDKQ